MLLASTEFNFLVSVFFRVNIIFSELFENNAVKTCSIGISVVTIILLIPFLWNIIQFERNNQNKTLLNSILESFTWHIIFWNLCVQPWVIFIFVYGPLGVEFLCTLDQVSRFTNKQLK